MATNRYYYVLFFKDIFFVFLFASGQEGLQKEYMYQRSILYITYIFFSHLAMLKKFRDLRK
jgi:hypothetical protein